jgi:hypothetical protein
MNKIILTLVFMVVLVISFPITRAYYTIQEIASGYDIHFITKSQTTNLNLSGANIAHFTNPNVGLFSTNIENIKFLGSFENIVPSIKTATIYYKIGDFISINGKFGSVVGNIDIFKQKLTLNANISDITYNKYKNIFRQFKKNKDKGYIYEFSF